LKTEERITELKFSEIYITIVTIKLLNTKETCDGSRKSFENKLKNSLSSNISEIQLSRNLLKIDLLKETIKRK
jgi:hypothetical protein